MTETPDPAERQEILNTAARMMGDAAPLEEPPAASTTPGRPDLEAIRRRTNTATPGPWERDPDPDYTPRQGRVYAYQRGGYKETIGDARFGEGEQADADERFFVHAQQDMDTLLAEVERLTRERDQARAHLEHARGQTELVAKDRERLARDRSRYRAAWQSARQGRAKARREERERCARMAEDDITRLPARIRALPDAEDAMCGATWTHQDHTHMCAREAPAGSEYVCHQEYTHTCAQPPEHKGAHIAAGDAARWLDLDAHDDA